MAYRHGIKVFSVAITPTENPNLGCSTKKEFRSNEGDIYYHSSDKNPD
jgi:hypothetical protein